MRIWLLSLLVLIAGSGMAQDSARIQMSSYDSISYELQRQKVNKLLDDRTARFGKFDESLRKRTGIFGLKTKKDMQASIDILKEIVLTDNAIFRETKNLLAFKDQQLVYKDFEKSQIEELANEYDQRIDGYITTISKLQKSNENLQQSLKKQQNAYITWMVLALLALLASAWLGYKWYLLQKK
jgi:uncharacterized protein YeeX (DUF496 family)